jgi:hypothetical protein
MSSISVSPEKKRDARRGFFLLLCSVCGFFASECVMAQSPEAQAVDKSAANLMVVLREAAGLNKQDEALVAPTGKMRLKLADGQEIETEMAWFAFLGDMHIRFVFDSPNSMLNAKPQDLERLNLSAAEALRLAVANIKRVYGDPVARPWTGGLMQVEGKSPDFDSSYFLDRAFWQGLLRQHPEGIVVAVAKRGGLLFTPITESQAVDRLRSGIAYLHSSSGKMRVSSALYLFKDDRWTVFQLPHAQ